MFLTKAYNHLTYSVDTSTHVDIVKDIFVAGDH